MAIVYFPENIRKKYKPAIDVIMQGKKIYTDSLVQDTTATGITKIISADCSWQIDSIRFLFSNATARNYDVTIQSGRKVVEGLNDSLWFVTPGTLNQQIILTPGFYTGTQLATQLQTQLNANVKYVAAGITFTVVYNNTTGIYTITPSSGTIKYLQTNNSQPLGFRDSYGGHLFGLTVNTSFDGTVTSNTPVMGLDSGASIIEYTGSTVLEHYHDTVHYLSIDQALKITTSAAALTVSLEVGYELLG